jgi:biotin transport system substrate-specific component
MAIGSVIIIFSGTVWFALLTHTNLLTVLRLSAVPFIPGDIIKIMLAAAVLPSGWKLLRKSH